MHIIVLERNRSTAFAATTLLNTLAPPLHVGPCTFGRPHICHSYQKPRIFTSALLLFVFLKLNFRLYYRTAIRVLTITVRTVADTNCVPVRRTENSSNFQLEPHTTSEQHWFDGELHAFCCCIRGCIGNLCRHMHFIPIGRHGLHIATR